MIIAIDPGNEKTGWALMDGKTVVDHGVDENNAFKLRLSWCQCSVMAYEMVACFGMPVGREIFDTCVWIGMFCEAFGPSHSHPVFRRDVKLHLCGNVRAKDGNIRQAILDMYEPSGGGKTPQIGTKSKPGPLYGVSTHIWPAIGVGLTFQGVSR